MSLQTEIDIPNGANSVGCQSAGEPSTAAIIEKLSTEVHGQELTENETLNTDITDKSHKLEPTKNHGESLETENETLNTHITDKSDKLETITNPEGPAETLETNSSDDADFAILPPSDTSISMSPSAKAESSANTNTTCNSVVETDDAKSPDVDSCKMMTNASKQKTRLWVGGLAQGTTEPEFANYFDTFGEVIDVDLHCRSETNSFGFVTFRNHSEALYCLTYNHHKLNRKRISVHWASAKPEKCEQRYRDYERSNPRFKYEGSERDRDNQRHRERFMRTDSHLSNNSLRSRSRSRTPERNHYTHHDSTRESERDRERNRSNRSHSRSRSRSPDQRSSRRRSSSHRSGRRSETPERISKNPPFRHIEPFDANDSQLSQTQGNNQMFNFPYSSPQSYGFNPFMFNMMTPNSINSMMYFNQPYQPYCMIPDANFNNGNNQLFLNNSSILSNPSPERSSISALIQSVKHSLDSNVAVSQN